MKLRKANRPTRLICNAGECGLCCQVTGGGVVVTKQEAKELPSEAIEKCGNHLVLKSLDGQCNQLIDYACGCYAVRPQGCREYPWYNIDGDLYYDSGCPGILHDRDGRPATKEIASIDNYFSTTPFWRNFLISILKLW